ncbi:MAG: hypothetical protein HY816_20045 [Candidatus Wallbacteria bacterium]|nr:hypothetical protein [Candidatus Wallbacteria bacterium]
MTHKELRAKLLAKLAHATAAQKHVRQQLHAIEQKAVEWEEQLGHHADAAAKVMQSSADRNPALEMKHRTALAGRARCQQLQAVLAHRGKAKP